MAILYFFHTRLQVLWRGANKENTLLLTQSSTFSVNFVERTLEWFNKFALILYSWHCEAVRQTVSVFFLLKKFQVLHYLSIGFEISITLFLAKEFFLFWLVHLHNLVHLPKPRQRFAIIANTWRCFIVSSLLGDDGDEHKSILITIKFHI